MLDFRNKEIGGKIPKREGNKDFDEERFKRRENDFFRIKELKKQPYENLHSS